MVDLMRSLTTQDYILIKEAKRAIYLNYNEKNQNHTVGSAILSKSGKNGDEIIPPCGNCRQILYDFMPNCDVILSVNQVLRKIQAKYLLPFAYNTEN